MQVRFVIDDIGLRPACSRNLVERYQIPVSGTFGAEMTHGHHWIPSTPSRVQAGEDRYGVRLRVTRQLGSTHIWASGSARTVVGKRIGWC
eukprot:5037644-Pyramimonas_sp.AAC.1